MSEIEFYTGVIESPVYSRQKSVVFMVVFQIPSDLRDRMTITELQEVHGVFPMNFPCTLPPGTRLKRGQWKWEITHYEFSPTLYKSKEQKMIPIIHTVFIYD